MRVFWGRPTCESCCRCGGRYNLNLGSRGAGRDAGKSNRWQRCSNVGADNLVQPARRSTHDSTRCSGRVKGRVKGKETGGRWRAASEHALGDNLLPRRCWTGCHVKATATCPVAPAHTPPVAGLRSPTLSCQVLGRLPVVDVKVTDSCCACPHLSQHILPTSHASLCSCHALRSPLGSEARRP